MTDFLLPLFLAICGNFVILKTKSISFKKNFHQTTESVQILYFFIQEESFDLLDSTQLMFTGVLNFLFTLRCNVYCALWIYRTFCAFQQILSIG